jgi:hypothetical protein
MLQSPRELLQAFVVIRYCPSHRSSYLTLQELQYRKWWHWCYHTRVSCSSSTGNNYQFHVCVFLLKSNNFSGVLCAETISTSILYQTLKDFYGFLHHGHIWDTSHYYGYFAHWYRFDLKPISTNWISAN